MNSFVIVVRQSDGRLVFRCNDGTLHEALMLDAADGKLGDTVTAPVGIVAAQED